MQWGVPWGCSAPSLHFFFSKILNPVTPTRPLTACSRPVLEDMPAVAALKAQGALLVGKSSMQELGHFP